jgi:hypothetical protein
LHQRVHSGRDARGVIASPETRHDLLINDSLADGIRKFSFQSVTDFDSHLPVLNENEKNRAIVLRSLADLPELKRANRKIFQGGVGRELLKHRYENLDGVGLLELFELLIETLAYALRNNLSVIVEISCWWRRKLFR